MCNNQEVVTIRAITRPMSKDSKRLLMIGFEACDRDGNQVDKSRRIEELIQKYPQASVQYRPS
jgi:hypothetical protein